MSTIRHTISLSITNSQYALAKAELLFDKQLSKYINYLLSKEREKEMKRNIQNKGGI